MASLGRPRHATLVNPNTCRLCGREDPNNFSIFKEASVGESIEDVINQYLPINIRDHNALPKVICSSCHIHLQATVSFFDSIVEGQKKMRQLINIENIAVAKCLKTIGTKGVDVQNITADFQVSGTFYSQDHPMSLKVDGLEKPRRKRGRPRKEAPPLEPEGFKETAPTQEAVENTEPPTTGETEYQDGKQRRKRKAPLRYQEAVQGIELEKIYREVGVAEEECIPSGSEPVIIGHVESGGGDEIGEIMIINKSNCTSKSVQKKMIQFSCELCQLTFNQESKFLKHQESHLNTGCICETCGEKFTDSKVLDAHQLVAHKNPPTNTKIESPDSQVMSCEFCSETFKFELSLKKHIASCHKVSKGRVSYSCDICNKTFHHPSSVKYHKKTEHSTGQRYVCGQCKKVFKHKQLLRKHQLVHTDERPYVCETCNSCFKTKSNLMNHASSHTGIKKFNCGECGQQFSHKTSLNLHLRWHSGLKPFTCDICSKSFTQKGNLQEHMRIHTGEKPYECAVCSRKFTTSSQYKLHLKRHAGVKPWECSFCKKSFLQKETWKYHVRRHLGVKPFKCNVCQRDFPDNWALKKHMRLHTGEKPFSCPVCSKSFSDYSNLIKHKKTHLKGLNKNEEKSLLFNSKGEEEPQVIYVTYQDPNDPNTKVSRKYLVGPGTELSSVESENQAIDDPESMQFLDEFGNPLQITLQDGTEIHLLDSSEPSSLVNDSQDPQLIPVHLITSEGDAVTTQITPVLRLANIVSVDQAIAELQEEDGSTVELIASNSQSSVQILETLPSSPSTFLNNIPKGELFS